MVHKELIKTLLDQHAALRTLLVTLAKEIGDGSTDAEKFYSELTLFRAKLTEHLKLEDEVFYPEVFMSLKAHGRDTTNTENFVSQMKTIGGRVFKYLDTYNSIEAIAKDHQLFAQTTQQTAGEILLRISVEEEGVYLYLQ